MTLLALRDAGRLRAPLAIIAMTLSRLYACCGAMPMKVNTSYYMTVYI